MNIFDFRKQLIKDYSTYIRSFIQIKNDEIRSKVDDELNAGLLWPEPLIQLNPTFETGEMIDELVRNGVLRSECDRIFRDKPELHSEGRQLKLHKHQSDAIKIARDGYNYVLTTGTGSGKSLSYIIPIVDHILRNGPGRGIQAIVVYPMNALANSQLGELTKFINFGYPNGKGPVRFARYTGQEGDEEKQQIIANPPDIILTNYVMLEYILTRPYEKNLIKAAQGLRFLVLDELHTYRGRQGADVALLVRRVRDRLNAHNLQCVGTSATLAGAGSYDEQRAEVAKVASQLFGAEVKPEHIVGETLRRATPDTDISDSTFIGNLRHRISNTSEEIPSDYNSFIKDPLSIWIETVFGIKKETDSDRLIRTEPISISSESGAASKLSNLTNIPIETCENAIQQGLLAGYNCKPNPETGRQPFAFRLHQFISRGDTVYASLGAEDDRLQNNDSYRNQIV
jgi:ATP-dependent helicase YprA (DUF1998 family)